MLYLGQIPCPWACFSIKTHLKQSIHWLRKRTNIKCLQSDDRGQLLFLKETISWLSSEAKSPLSLITHSGLRANTHILNSVQGSRTTSRTCALLLLKTLATSSLRRCWQSVPTTTCCWRGNRFNFSTRSSPLFSFSHILISKALSGLLLLKMGAIPLFRRPISLTPQ